MSTNCCLTPSDVPSASKSSRFTKWQYLAALLCGQKDTNANLIANASGQLLAPDGSVLTVKRQARNIAASQTDAVGVAAVAGKKIRVLGLVLHGGDSAGSAVTLNTKPSGSGTAISPVFELGINQSVVLPQSKDGWFETTAGQGLSITTGAGSTTGIQIIYVEV